MASGFIKYITDKNYRFVRDAAHGKYNDMADDEYVRRMFRAKMGYELDLGSPKTFNEKLQWLKLYNRDPMHSVMVDKYAVKEYVARKIGNEYIIPTLGVWDSPDEIDFDVLPQQFVLKCTHDSHGLVICKDKNQLNIDDVKKRLKNSLDRNYYLRFREWPYKNVQPRIIAEQYMEDSATGELRDYKFFCFGGIVKCYKVDFDRFIRHRANYFAANGELIKIGEEVCPPDYEKIIPVPAKLEEMKGLASILSEGQVFLRVDFYSVDEKVYFGELTFSPASGYGKFVFEGNDELLGSWIELPLKESI